jgi:hypothetical protein
MLKAKGTSASARILSSGARALFLHPFKTAITPKQRPSLMMSTTSVFATATSTIHADLIIVALKRVGISTGGISILYPNYSRPDSLLYWVDGATKLTLSPAGETVTVSGPLRFALDRHQEHSEFPSLVGGLRSLGLNEEQSMGFESALVEERVVLCIEAADESQLALIFHILHHIGAGKIVLTATASRPQQADRRPSQVPSGVSRRNASESPLSLSAA